MPKFGSLQIDNRILDAIRDDRLVIFAGAGVSMGPPANLPDFVKLANDIAVGTIGLVRAENEPIDRFLGRLAHKEIKVHQLAAQHLSKPASTPTSLHLDLLRLFRSHDRVRIVTTNFDLLFEAAAQVVYDKCPEMFRAPALPLGRDFRGLVHVHGALTHPDEMVMTDADFGRGYLTEGWARRFLLELFKIYTVLFVGYSHDDAVMHYLARALPVDGDDGDIRRFVLTDEDGSWDLLGIKPIRFRKNEGENAFQELYDGVRLLSERVTRGVLDWKSALAEIANRVPPADEKIIGEVEQALREVYTTRFLIDEARLPEWPKWLNTRKHLDALFESASLNERDKLLSQWLAKHYAIDHANEVIELIAAHNMRLSPEMWRDIGGELGLDNEKTLDDSTLSRWVPILLSSAPAHADPHVLTWLAERCAKQNNIKMALEVFLYMGSHHLMVKPGFNWAGGEIEGEATRLEVQTPLRGEHYELNEVWENQLKPNLAAIAQPLLLGIARQLEEIHHTLLAWNVAERDWDSISWHRSAIEPHEQDNYPEALDVLIDAGRDALEWLALNQPALLDAWMEQLAISDIPLLRRLAIHALTVHPEKSADDRLNWLMTHMELHCLAEHHEIHRAAALAYPAASSAVKQSVVDAVLRHQLPDAENWTAAERTARAHFDWLDWLHQADPACELVQTALNPIKATYPDWSQSEHPDMTHWMGSGWVGSRSPWTVEQLLAKSPSEQFEELRNFQGDWFRGPDRNGLLSTIQEACKQRPIWAFDLDDAISARALWESDLWAPMLRGLRNAELPLDDWKNSLNRIARHELYVKHAYEIAEMLYAMVRDGGKPFALEFLDQANIIAFDLWQSLSCDDEEGVINDWLSRAINRTAGILVEFWINGLSLRLHGKSGDERTLPNNYREWFTTVAHEETIAGGLGRSILASQVAFLFGLDERWTGEHIIPLFTSPDTQKFSQAWDGFLVWGRFNTPLVEALQPAFLAALPRLGTDLADRRRRFIEFFTMMAVSYIDDPTHELLPALLNNNSIEDRRNFASQIGLFLRQIDEPARQNLWERWLHRYWQNRLNSIPLPLDESEARQMLEWLPHLGEQYPQGVALAVRASISRIEHTDLIYQMQKSDLVTRFPTETAELLIYLCPRVLGYHGRYISIVAKRLSALDPEFQRRLSEAMARAGFDL